MTEEYKISQSRISSARNGTLSKYKSKIMQTKRNQTGVRMRIHTRSWGRYVRSTPHAQVLPRIDDM